MTHEYDLINTFSIQSNIGVLIHKFKMNSALIHNDRQERQPASWAVISKQCK